MLGLPLCFRNLKEKRVKEVRAEACCAEHRLLSPRGPGAVTLRELKPRTLMRPSSLPLLGKFALGAAVEGGSGVPLTLRLGSNEVAKVVLEK